MRRVRVGSGRRRRSRERIRGFNANEERLLDPRRGRCPERVPATRAFQVVRHCYRRHADSRSGRPRGDRVHRHRFRGLAAVDATLRTMKIADGSQVRLRTSGRRTGSCRLCRRERTVARRRGRGTSGSALAGGELEWPARTGAPGAIQTGEIVMLYSGERNRIHCATRRSGAR